MIEVSPDNRGDGYEVEDDPFAEARERGAKPWLDAIKDAQSFFQSYDERCKNVEELYASLEKLAKMRADREYQMFWANMEVLKPSIYSRPPVPVVMPRFRERKEITTKAADVLERALITSYEIEEVDAELRCVRDDLALCARGQIWARYEQDERKGEKVCYEHVHRLDFLHEPARKWKEVGWVARRSYLTMRKGRERFGDVFARCQFDKVEDQSGKKYTSEKKAQVWELWSKTENLVVWVSPGNDDILDIQEPFLSLDGFFPCPKPAYGTLEPGSLMPVPDVLFYKDQLEEINELTAKIAALSESLKLRGFYPAGESDLAEAIESAIKNTDSGAVLVPIQGALIGQGAGLKDQIIWLPVAEIAGVIKELIEQRRQVVDDVYQITGLSDIMRGATNPNETLGAQQLKSQYGSIRIRDKQFEMVRISRDITRIAGEIMAENFFPQTLLDMSQVDIPTMQQVQQQIQQAQFQAAMQGQPFQPPQQMPITIDAITNMLREERMRPFLLEIETDSTIQPDEDAEKQRRTEFISAVGGFMRESIPLGQAVPQAVPMITETLKFVAAGFRAGRALETEIDTFAEQMKQMAKNPQPNPQQEAMKQEMQAKAQEHQVNLQLKQIDGQIKQLEVQMKQIELQRAGIEAQTAANTPEVEPIDVEPYAEDRALAEVRKMNADADKTEAEIANMYRQTEIKGIEAAARMKQASQKPAPAKRTN